MPFRRSNEKASNRSPKQIWADWLDANEAGDVARASSCAVALTEAAPASFSAWFEAGLHAKARREWDRCVAYNSRALEVYGKPQAEEFGGANPSAWNLGIAARQLVTGVPLAGHGPPTASSAWTRVTGKSRATSA